MLAHLSKPKIYAIWALIFLLGAASAYVGFTEARDRILGGLIEDARRSALGFGSDDVRPLTATKDDLKSEKYTHLKERLKRMRAINPRVRFVYIFRYSPATGKVTFLADSEVETSEKISQPGDDYPQASVSPGLQSIIRSGQPATEGPIPDDFGVWVTGYALVDEHAGMEAGSTEKDILGIDLDASDWRREVWGAAALHGIFVWLLLSVPFAGLLASRRQLEARAAIRNLSQAVEQSESSVLIVDLESRIEYANAGLCRQMGYTRRELLGRVWRDFPQDGAAVSVFAEVSSLVRAGQTWSGEWLNRRKDGTTFPVRGAVTPVRGRDGRITCFVALFNDMTEIKRQETVLREARDRAEAGDKAKSQFLATMSHEVRTPLNGIIGFTNLLKDTSLTTEQREYVQTIRSSSDALMQLTGDILDLARIETGKLRLDPQTCDPRECVDETLDLFAGTAAAKRIELLHTIDDNVPATISVDSGRLRQVLANLVGNAVKFTDAGAVEVRVSVAAEPPPAAGEATLVFSVRDTGIGIAPDDQAKLFKPFSQVDQSITRRFGGTGLGLAISKNLLDLMGGSISVESTAGRGSTFTFKLRMPSGPPPAASDLGKLRVALVAPAGEFRRELEGLVSRWGGVPLAVEHESALAGQTWELGCVELDTARAEALARDSSAHFPLPAEKTCAIVPLSLGAEVRGPLRKHFRVLINKPVHHCGFFRVLAGTRTNGVVTEPAEQLGLHVLIVEDNAVNLRLMQRVLASIGCTYGQATNGRLAIEELARPDAHYHAVLMDLHMPELDGLTAIERVRAGDAGEKVKDIWMAALTADARAEQRERVIAAGAQDYLTKPLRTPDLIVALKQCRARLKPA